MSQRSRGHLRDRVRRRAAARQKASGSSAPPGKRQPRPMTAIGSRRAPLRRPRAWPAARRARAGLASRATGWPGLQERAHRDAPRLPRVEAAVDFVRQESVPHPDPDEVLGAGLRVTGSLSGLRASSRPSASATQVVGERLERRKSKSRVAGRLLAERALPRAFRSSTAISESRPSSSSGWPGSMASGVEPERPGPPRSPT